MSNIQKLELAKHTERVRDWKTKTETVIESVNEVWEKKLWRHGYDSFKDWLEIGCGVTKQWGYEILKTAKTRHLLSETGVKSVDSGLPSLQALTKAETAQITPSVRKVLDTIPLASQVAVVREAAAAGKVTAKTVEAAAEKIVDAVLVHRDETEIAREIPANVLPLWQEATRIVDELLPLARKLKQEIKNGVENKEQNLVWIDATNGDTSPVQATINLLTLTIKPFAVCYRCHGVRPKQCKLCRGRGYIGRHLWTTCPAEEKAILLKGGK